MPLDPNVVSSLLDVDAFVRMLGATIERRPDRKVYYALMDVLPAEDYANGGGFLASEFRGFATPNERADWEAAIDAAFADFGQILNLTFLPVMSAPPGTRPDIRVGLANETLRTYP